MPTYSRESHVVPVLELTQAGEARRVAMGLAGRLGFPDVSAGQLGIVVTEAATNLARHAQEGEMVIQSVVCGEAVGVEVLAMDRGPGMAALPRCMEDGYSTGGSRGEGLGAIRRQANVFDIYSQPGKGTVLLAQVWVGGCVPLKGGLLGGAVSVPKAGEEACGDAWVIAQDDHQTLCMVTDGLGHGPLAAEAAVEARRMLLENRSLGPVRLLELAHGALRKTRGAAMAVAQIRRDRQVLTFAGVGNIAGTIWAQGTSRSVVSHNGIIGAEVRKIQEYEYPWPAGALLVMASDGLATQWRLDDYPGLAMRHPTLIAGLLYRDFARGRDDVTVLAVHEA